MVRLADTQPIPLHPEQAPPLSKGVVKVWEAYTGMSGDEEEKAQIRSADITATLHDFAGQKGLIPSTYEAAYLIELMEKQSGDDKFQAEYAHEAIKSYKGKTQQDTDYVRGIAADSLEIGKFLAEHYQHSAASRGTDGNPWLPTDDIEIPLQDIFHLTSDIPGEGVEHPLGVNIESILIAAASAYNTLRNAEDFTEDELQKTIYAVENLYQPFLAYVRYDGFEVALKQAVGLVRMKYAEGVEGVITQHDVDYARALLHDTGLDSYDNVVNTVPNVLRSLFPNSDATARGVLHNISSHDVKIGVASIYLESDPDYLDFGELGDDIEEATLNRLSVRWRAKDVVSVAENNQKNPNKYIADMLGLTVIVPNYEEAAEMMAIAYRSSEFFNSVQTQNSASRNTAISVKGNTMPATVLPILVDRLKDMEPNIETKSSDNGHQVGKITFLYRNNYRGKVYDVPVEIMFQTPEDREVSNVGEAAHALKSKKYRPLTPEEIRFQKRFHERRMEISKAGLTALSRKRSEALFPGKKTRREQKYMGGAGLREFIRSDTGTTIDYP